MIENEQWHLDRLNGLGGSDAAIILGLSPWKSRLELWNTKVNKIIDSNPEENLIFQIGHALEPIIADHYSKMTGRILETRSQKTHIEHPFITGNIDREIVKSERSTPGILEIKTRGAHINWHEDEIPPYYISQLQHYMAIYGYTWGSFAVLDLGKREITYTDIERDDVFIEKLIEEEKKFWKLVTDKIPPEIEPTKSCENFLKEHFNQSEPITIDLSNNDTATKYAEKLKHVKVTRKGLEESEIECKTFFMNLMKEAEKAIGNNYTITWRNDKDSIKFDTDSFKIENPEIYKKYMMTNKGTRRFLSKFSKE